MRQLEQYKAEDITNKLVECLNEETIDEFIHEAGLDTLRDFAASI